MKNYFLGGLLIIISICSLSAQTDDQRVGIGTEQPRGVLHITAPETPSDQGLVINSDNNDGITVVLEGERTTNTAHPSASVSLDAANKAFLPNRVALVDARGTVGGQPIPGQPIQNPVNGMVVYNTQSAGLSPNNVAPGLYVYHENVNKWLRVMSTPTIDLNAEANVLLLNNVMPVRRMTSAYSTATNFLNFLTPTDALSLKKGTDLIGTVIEMEEDAAYAMAINFDGIHNTNITGTTYERMDFYVAAVRLNQDGSKTILDIKRFFVPAFSGTTEANRRSTYSASLGFNAKVGERISVYIVGGFVSGTGSTTTRIWTLTAEQTTVLFWKI
jgi:hypothetical protein